MSFFGDFVGWFVREKGIGFADEGLCRCKDRNGMFMVETTALEGRKAG